MVRVDRPSSSVVKVDFSSASVFLLVISADMCKDTFYRHDCKSKRVNSPAYSMS